MNKKVFLLGLSVLSISSAYAVIHEKVNIPKLSHSIQQTSAELEKSEAAGKVAVQSTTAEKDIKEINKERIELAKADKEEQELIPHEELGSVEMKKLEETDKEPSKAMPDIIKNEITIKDEAATPAMSELSKKALTKSTKFKVQSFKNIPEYGNLDLVPSAYAYTVSKKRQAEMQNMGPGLELRTIGYVDIKGQPDKIGLVTAKNFYGRNAVSIVNKKTLLEKSDQHLKQIPGVTYDPELK